MLHDHNIIDYKLRVDGKSSVAANTSREENLVTYKESVGNNVTLLCSSSLTGDSDTALDIQVVFIFRSSSGAKHIKSAGCSNGEDVAAEANWIISRQQFPPYDCTLTIVDFGSKDIGEYQCAGLLPRGDSQYKHDWSKVTVSLLNHDLPAKPTERKSNYLPLISIAAVLLLFVPFLLYKVYRRRQQDQGPTLVHASSTASEFFHAGVIITIEIIFIRSDKSSFTATKLWHCYWQFKHR